MTRRFVNGWLVAGFALAIASTLSAQTIQEQAAKVVRISGKARFMPKGGEWQPLTPGQILAAGTVIQTGMDRDSYVDIVFARNPGSQLRPMSHDFRPPGYLGPGGGGVTPATAQTVVRLFENTVVSLDKLNATETGEGLVTDTQLDLRKGHIFGNVKKMTAGSAFNINCPAGVTAIRGSCFDILLTDVVVNGVVKIRAHIRMVFGSAVVTFTDDQGNVISVTVLQGQGLSTDQNASSPIPPEILKILENLLPDLTIQYGPPTEKTLGTDQTVVQITTLTQGVKPPSGGGVVTGGSGTKQ